MLSTHAAKRWLSLHRWLGLVLSLNMALFSITGLVLIFREPIDRWLGDMPQARGAERVDAVPLAVMAAERALPGRHPLIVRRDPERYPGLLLVGVGKGKSRALRGSQSLTYDAQTLEPLGEIDFRGTFTGVIWSLHAELFAGPLGRLLVGVVGLVLLVTLIAGAVAYGPIMRRFRLGTLRFSLSPRTWMADLHKYFGVLSFGWLVLVTCTGILLSLSSVLINLYAATELRQLTAAYIKEPIVDGAEGLSSALATAHRLSSGQEWTTILLPGSELSSPVHYAFLTESEEGGRSMRLVLVDARNPTQGGAHELPGYLRAVLLSEPLHFGNYGGLPLQLLWSAFASISTFLALSGVFVFFKGRSKRARQGSALGAADTDAIASNGNELEISV